MGQYDFEVEFELSDDSKIQSYFEESLIDEKLNANSWIISPHYPLPPVATMQKTNALYQVFYKCQWILNVQWKYSFYHENA